LLARNPAAHADLTDPDAVARLLGALREAGAGEQVETLVNRLPAEGLFDLFRKQPWNERRYKFGRELDGAPAPSWDWYDLG